MSFWDSIVDSVGDLFSSGADAVGDVVSSAADAGGDWWDTAGSLLSGEGLGSLVDSLGSSPDWGSVSSYLAEAANPAGDLLSRESVSLLDLVKPEDIPQGFFTGHNLGELAGSAMATGLGNAAKQPENWLQKIADIDPKTAKLGLSALGMLNSIYNNSRAKKNAVNPAQLQAMLKSPYSSWTPEQQAAATKYFGQLGRSYRAPVSRIEAKPVIGMKHGGALGCLCNGGAAMAGGGQADDVDARLSQGEYVIDADVVAALGDGNTEAGAAQLDRMREAVRQHKRSAPADSIPPPARTPLEYLTMGGE